MNNFDFSIYDITDETPVKPLKEKEQKKQPQKAQDFDFDAYDYSEEEMNSTEFKDNYEESALASGFRTVAQIPQGILEATGPGQLAGLQSLLSMEVYDPEEIERLKEISAREGIPFDEEAYLEAANRAMGTIPTIGNIASKIEEKTGLPLEPKTENQKRLRFLSMATKAVAPKGNLTKAMQPAAKNPTALSFRGLNTQLPAPVLGAGVTATRELLMQMGVPEQFADLAAFGILKPTTEGAPSLISPQKKPSGLTTRRYEKLTEPTEVSGKKIKQIQQKTAKEAKGLGEEIIKESPVGETYQKMKEDISYKRGVEEGFEEVRKLASEQKGEVDYANLKKKLKSKIPKEKGIEVTPVSKEKAKLFKEFIKDLGKGKASITELERRYRINNENAAKSYDPGQSWEANQAKREAFFEYNQAIADVFEEIAPNTEFLNKFRQRNAEWKSLMDAEMIDNFLEQMTKGKIRYEKGKDFFKKKGMDTKFKRALGKEGYSKFETLMKDLMSTEEAFNLLQKKPDPGLMPFVKKAMYFAVDPSLGKAKFGFDLLKGGYQKMFEMLLDKPELAVNWDRGINALKKGDIKVANQELGKVAQAEKALTDRQKAFDKYKEYKKQKSTDKTTEQTTKTKTDPNKTKEKENLSGIGDLGKGITESFYEGIFDSLKKGKDTFSGVKDPLLQAAKPAYEAGQIKSVNDLKAFAKFYLETKKNKK